MKNTILEKVGEKRKEKDLQAGTLFRDKQQSMTNKELADLVSEETAKMCKTGGKSFTMRVKTF